MLMFVNKQMWVAKNASIDQNFQKESASDESNCSERKVQIKLSAKCM